MFIRHPASSGVYMSPNVPPGLVNPRAVSILVYVNEHSEHLSELEKNNLVDS